MLFYIRIRFQDDVSLSNGFFFFFFSSSRRLVIFFSLSYLFFFCGEAKGRRGRARNCVSSSTPRGGGPCQSEKKKDREECNRGSGLARKIVFRSFRLWYQVNLARRGKKKRRKRYKDAPHPRSTLFILKCVIRPTPWYTSVQRTSLNVRV